MGWQNFAGALVFLHSQVSDGVYVRYGDNKLHTIHGSTTAIDGSLKDGTRWQTLGSKLENSVARWNLKDIINPI